PDPATAVPVGADADMVRSCNPEDVQQVLHVVLERGLRGRMAALDLAPLARKLAQHGGTAPALGLGLVGQRTPRGAALRVRRSVDQVRTQGVDLDPAAMRGK